MQNYLLNFFRPKLEILKYMFGLQQNLQIKLISNKKLKKARKSEIFIKMQAIKFVEILR